MRKYLWLAASGVLAVLVYAQLSAGQLLANYAKTLGEAKSLKVSYTVQSLEGAPSAYQLDFAKPNMAKIDTPTEIITADGSNIVRYDKAQKTYYKEPQTDAGLKSLLGADEYGIWSAFFNSQAFAKASAKSLGTFNRKGMQVTGVEASFDEGKKKVVYYLAVQDNLARQAEIGYADRGSSERLLVNAKSIEIGGEAKPELFAFKAPEGSRELTQEERMSAVWFDDLEAAKTEAAKTKRLIFIDFYAEW
jgi:outer membrane lipoprotein-sorting protein